MASVRRLSQADILALEHFWEQHWGAGVVVAHDTIYRPQQVDGFVVGEGDEWVGLVTYVVAGAAIEIVSLDSLREGQGIGSKLIAAVVEQARMQGIARIWLITTNDNLPALRFYQKRGFAIVRVDRGAVDRSRSLKPSIPALGHAGIPIHDEIELELLI